jgi:hypothetical protein
MKRKRKKTIDNELDFKSLKKRKHEIIFTKQEQQHEIKGCIKFFGLKTIKPYLYLSKSCVIMPSFCKNTKTGNCVCVKEFKMFLPQFYKKQICLLCYLKVLTKTYFENMLLFFTATASPFDDNDDNNNNFHIKVNLPGELKSMVCIGSKYEKYKILGFIPMYYSNFFTVHKDKYGLYVFWKSRYICGETFKIKEDVETLPKPNLNSAVFIINDNHFALTESSKNQYEEFNDVCTKGKSSRFWKDDIFEKMLILFPRFKTKRGDNKHSIFIGLCYKLCESWILNKKVKFLNFLPLFCVLFQERHFEKSNVEIRMLRDFNLFFPIFTDNLLDYVPIQGILKIQEIFDKKDDYSYKETPIIKMLKETLPRFSSGRNLNKLVFIQYNKNKKVKLFIDNCIYLSMLNIYDEEDFFEDKNLNRVIQFQKAFVLNSGDTEKSKEDILKFLFSEKEIIDVILKEYLFYILNIMYLKNITKEFDKNVYSVFVANKKTLNRKFWRWFFSKNIIKSKNNTNKSKEKWKVYQKIKTKKNIIINLIESLKNSIYKEFILYNMFLIPWKVESSFIDLKEIKKITFDDYKNISKKIYEKKFDILECLHLFESQPFKISKKDIKILKKCLSEAYNKKKNEMEIDRISKYGKSLLLTICTYVYKLFYISKHPLHKYEAQIQRDDKREYEKFYHTMCCCHTPRICNVHASTKQNAAKKSFKKKLGIFDVVIYPLNDKKSIDPRNNKQLICLKHFYEDESYNDDDEESDDDDDEEEEEEDNVEEEEEDNVEEEISINDEEEEGDALKNNLSGIRYLKPVIKKYMESMFLSVSKNVKRHMIETLFGKEESDKNWLLLTSSNELKNTKKICEYITIPLPSSPNTFSITITTKNKIKRKIKRSRGSVKNKFNKGMKMKNYNNIFCKSKREVYKEVFLKTIHTKFFSIFKKIGKHIIFQEWKKYFFFKFNKIQIKDTIGCYFKYGFTPPYSILRLCNTCRKVRLFERYYYSTCSVCYLKQNKNNLDRIKRRKMKKKLIVMNFDKHRFF